MATSYYLNTVVGFSISGLQSHDFKFSRAVEGGGATERSGGRTGEATAHHWGPTLLWRLHDLQSIR